MTMANDVANMKEEYGIDFDDNIAEAMLSSITELIVSMYVYACKEGRGDITDILMDIKMALCKNATREPQSTTMCGHSLVTIPLPEDMNFDSGPDSYEYSEDDSFYNSEDMET